MAFVHEERQLFYVAYTFIKNIIKLICEAYNILTSIPNYCEIGSEIWYLIKTAYWIKPKNIILL